MAKFVMGSQRPDEFRKCKLNYDQAEFNDGKKKNFIITLNTMQLNPEENLYQQSYYQGKSKLNFTGKSLEKAKAQKKTLQDIDSMPQEHAKEKFGMSKLQLKQFSKQCVALKVGIAKNREYGIVVPYEKSPVRQITSAKNDRKHKIEFKKIEYENKTEEDDTNMDFFSYLQDLNVRPQTAKISSGPQFRGSKQYFVESDRLNRIEYDSSTQINKQTELEKTFREKYDDKKLEKANNSIVMNQHPTGHAKTDAGEKYMQYLSEYQKNKSNFKKFSIVKRGTKGQMSSLYPPMFERARLTKVQILNTILVQILGKFQKLYYKTTYKNYYQPPLANCFKTGGGKFGTVEFRKTYRPILFNS